MNAKSDYAKYCKAIKKRFIKKLGRKEGGRVNRQNIEWHYGWFLSFTADHTAKQATEDIIRAYRYERAENRRMFKRWLSRTKLIVNNDSNLIVLINSPGGEIDPAEGILREFKMQIAIPRPDMRIYIDPYTHIAY